MTSYHLRNTGPMLKSPRCSALTRSDNPCGSPAVSGTSYCRMHGGTGPVGSKAYRRLLRNCLEGLMLLEEGHEARQLVDRVLAEMAAIGYDPDA